MLICPRCSGRERVETRHRPRTIIIKSPPARNSTEWEAFRGENSISVKSYFEKERERLHAEAQESVTELTGEWETAALSDQPGYEPYVDSDEEEGGGGGE